MGSLPPDWQELTTEDGYPYYWNVNTNETAWERPSFSPKNTLSSPSSPASSSPAPGRPYANTGGGNNGGVGSGGQKKQQYYIPIQRAPDADEPMDYSSKTRHEGFLWKKGAVRRNWKRRWFILDNGRMEYYDSREAAVEARSSGVSRSLGYFDVKGLTARPVVGKYANAFQVTTLTRIYMMYAETPGEFSIWKDKLRENGANWEGRAQSFIREDGSVQNTRPMSPPPPSTTFTSNSAPRYQSGPAISQGPSYSEQKTQSLPPLYNNQQSRGFQPYSPPSPISTGPSSVPPSSISQNIDHIPTKGPAKDIGTPTLLSKPNPIVPKGYRQPNYDSSGGGGGGGGGQSTSVRVDPGPRPSINPRGVQSAESYTSPSGYNSSPYPQRAVVSAESYSNGYGNNSSGANSYSPSPANTGRRVAPTIPGGSSPGISNGNKKCPTCGSSWPQRITFCGNCGSRV